MAEMLEQPELPLTPPFGEGPTRAGYGASAHLPFAQGRVAARSITLTLLLLMGVLLPGCSSVRHLAERTLLAEPDGFDWDEDRETSLGVYRGWADQAWHQQYATNPEACQSGEYQSGEYMFGFKDGFVDYVFAGGTGEPPAIPPRRFWNVGARGQSMADDWFAGYRHGASIARDEGYRDRVTLRPSQFLTCASDVPYGGAPSLAPPMTEGLPLEILPEAEPLPAPQPASQPQPTGPEFGQPEEAHFPEVHKHGELRLPMASKRQKSLRLATRLDSAPSLRATASESPVSSSHTNPFRPMGVAPAPSSRKARPSAKQSPRPAMTREASVSSLSHQDNPFRSSAKKSAPAKKATPARRGPQLRAAGQRGSLLQSPSHRH